jgi:hypothetical protein
MHAMSSSPRSTYSSTTASACRLRW